MKHTIAQNKQLFNVKAIADAVTLENLAEGTLGIFAEGSDTSIASNIVFSTLPERFRIISKLNGKVYYSFDTIEKASMKNILAQAYTAPKVNIWEGIIDHFDCIKTVQVKVNLEEDSLMRERGMSWFNADSTVVEAPAEIRMANCADIPVRANHLMTVAIAKALNDADSPYYKALVKIDLSDKPVYADQTDLDTANATPDKGDLGVVTADGLKVYDGTDWKIIGDVTGRLSDAETYLEATKALNLSATAGDHTDKLTLVIEGKAVATPSYKDLDINYINPRGAKLIPAITINGGDGAVAMKEVQAITYEMNAGADLRAEEFASMSLYTTLNHRPQLHDGIATDALVYQFENGKTYSTVDFEFYTDKVNKNDGDKRSFGVMLATSESGVFTRLKAIFGIA